MKKTALETILGDLYCNEPITAPKSLLEIVKTEVKKYLAEPSIPLNMSVHEWWSTNKALYPHLAKLAKRVLVVQATSVSAERVFSLAGDLISDKRSRLCSENVDQVIFLNKNRKLVDKNLS